MLSIPEKKQKNASFELFLFCRESDSLLGNTANNCLITILFTDTLLSGPQYTAAQNYRYVKARILWLIQWAKPRRAVDYQLMKKNVLQLNIGKYITLYIKKYKWKTPWNRKILLIPFEKNNQSVLSQNVPKGYEVQINLWLMISTHTMGPKGHKCHVLSRFKTPKTFFGKIGQLVTATFFFSLW